jgi:quercetin dioxygenase-like cupin family protein
MIFEREKAKPVEMMPGIIRRTLLSSGDMMLAEFSFEKGAGVPTHSHPHEQMGYLVSGRMRMTMGDDTVDCEPGDSWHAPPNLPHSGVALEPSVIVEAFRPAREDYL